MSGLFASIAIVLLCCFLTVECADSVCATKARKMGFAYEYGWGQGCMIRVNQHWVPIESYRVVGEAP